YFPYRFYRQRILGQVEWGKEFLHHLQKIDIEDEFLVGGSQPAFQPACSMQEEITSALDGSPQGKDALIGSLRINGVCGAGVRGSIGDAVAPGELPPDKLGLHVFRRSEGERARLHVDIGCKAAIADRSAFPDHLCKGDAG